MQDVFFERSIRLRMFVVVHVIAMRDYTAVTIQHTFLYVNYNLRRKTKKKNIKNSMCSSKNGETHLKHKEAKLVCLFYCSRLEFFLFFFSLVIITQNCKCWLYEPQ